MMDPHAELEINTADLIHHAPRQVLEHHVAISINTSLAGIL
jgi:hypothetical protein